MSWKRRYRYSRGRIFVRDVNASSADTSTLLPTSPQSSAPNKQNNTPNPSPPKPSSNSNNSASQPPNPNHNNNSTSPARSGSSWACS